jgi:hypothetical protein
MQLSYSFHVGNQKNAIKKLSNLAKTENHNARNYKDYNKWKAENDIINNIDKSDNVYLIGNKNLVDNIKKIYDKEFKQAILDYNRKQKQPSRRIKNYLNKINDSKNQHVATEIIIQLGQRTDWENISLEDRQKILPIFQNQIKKLQNDYPNFKIAQAVVHLDENSPHLHIVGVPIGYSKTDRGLSVKVQKSAVFNQKSLFKMQHEFRDLALRDSQKYLYSNVEFKPKAKGRNSDYKKQEYVKLDNAIKEKRLELEHLRDDLYNLQKEILTFNSTKKNSKITNLELQEIPKIASPVVGKDMFLISKDEVKRTQDKLKMLNLYIQKSRVEQTNSKILKDEIESLENQLDEINKTQLQANLLEKKKITKQLQNEINSIKEENYQIKELYKPEITKMFVKENKELKDQVFYLQKDKEELQQSLNELNIKHKEVKKKYRQLQNKLYPDRGER